MKISIPAEKFSALTSFRKNAITGTYGKITFALDVEIPFAALYVSVTYEGKTSRYRISFKDILKGFFAAYVKKL